MRKLISLSSEHILKVIFCEFTSIGYSIIRLECLRLVDVNLYVLVPTHTAYKNRYALKTVGNENLGLDISATSVSGTCKH